MLVQALAEYADHYLADELNDAAWEMKPVPWSLEISRQGRFLNATPRMKEEMRGKKQVQVPMQMSVPRSPVNRNSGEHPLLGTDDIAYVLGVGPWTPDKPADKEKAEKHHEAFVALIGKAAKETVAPHKGAWIATTLSLLWLAPAWVNYYIDGVSHGERVGRRQADCQAWKGKTANSHRWPNSLQNSHQTNYTGKAGERKVSITV